MFFPGTIEELEIQQRNALELKEEKERGNLAQQPSVKETPQQRQQRMQAKRRMAITSANVNAPKSLQRKDPAETQDQTIRPK